MTLPFRVQPSTLYGVGLGPGAPDLLTLRAAQCIAQADVIAYPTPVRGKSLARSIAAPHLKEHHIELAFDLPMSTSRSPAQEAYDIGCTHISSYLNSGRSVAVLCEGDPLFYGSFMYISARLSSKHKCEIIPGVPSICAAASTAQWPLCARNEVLTVLPATLPSDTLADYIQRGATLAIMKVGRHIDKLKTLADKLGCLEHALYVERATHPEQEICPLGDAPSPAPYFSMVLLRKEYDPWI